MLGRPHLLGLGINALYLVGWVITLIGLAVNQNWCEDHVRLPLVSGHTFLAHEIGKDCKTLFRFPWFIWALSSLPVLLSVGHLLRPTVLRRGSAALFAVLATLHMIAAETFHDILRSNLADSYKKFERGSKVTTVGFALMATMSLLLIIFESFLGDHCHQRRATATTKGAEVGAVAAPEVGGRAVMAPHAGATPVTTPGTAEVGGLNKV